jgi:hypothetical protein
LALGLLVRKARRILISYLGNSLLNDECLTEQRICPKLESVGVTRTTAKEAKTALKGLGRECGGVRDIPGALPFLVIESYLITKLDAVDPVFTFLSVP